MASGRSRIPLAIIIGLVVAVVLDTFVQVTWKLAVTGLPDAGGPFAIVAAALARPLFYLAIAGFVAQLANWLLVLRRADLSFAQPFTALSYVTVLLIARIFLQESVSVTRLLGVVLILAGVLLVSRTPARTSPGERPR